METLILRMNFEANEAFPDGLLLYFKISNAVGQTMYKVKTMHTNCFSVTIL